MAKIHHQCMKHIKAIDMQALKEHVMVTREAVPKHKFVDECNRIVSSAYQKNGAESLGLEKPLKTPIDEAWLRSSIEERYMRATNAVADHEEREKQKQEAAKAKHEREVREMVGAPPQKLLETLIDKRIQAAQSMGDPKDDIENDVIANKLVNELRPQRRRWNTSSSPGPKNMSVPAWGPGVSKGEQSKCKGNMPLAAARGKGKSKGIGKSKGKSKGKGMKLSPHEWSGKGIGVQPGGAGKGKGKSKHKGKGVSRLKGKGALKGGGAWNFGWHRV